MPLEYEHCRFPEPIAEIASVTNAAGGAVLVFDAQDRILYANDEQRKLMPCCDYGKDDTYSTLFWLALKFGYTGNPNAKADPNGWLVRAIGARLNIQSMDFVNQYQWGAMLVSHFRLENGISIQARLDMRKNALDHYFTGPGSQIGVTRAIRLREEILGLESALDSLGLAVALISHNRKILHANASFKDMLRKEDGLTLSPVGREVVATDVCDEFVFQQAVENVTSGALPSTYVPVRRCRHDPLILAISAAVTPGAAIIAAARFGEDVKAINAALREALGFSIAEADVVTGIGQGKSVNQVALDRGVSEGSTYQHLHKARIKLKNSSFVAPDMAAIASLVTGIAAITRVPNRRKH
ncbi:helix-turn-helix transcriptional regulator [Azospirillum lipoferum]|uniref:PAS domain-containing protein n=1 Tax=Azospirillum lipoferum (strain 4B) TaxID=862719 RepID=G7ZC83_AZOL4|nr:PAS domain-containing protein [Azospirillum lipoferum]CBS89188.1 conserved protein of unknown function; DNA-binding domain [Azospirillum lipoferum 4B]